MLALSLVIKPSYLSGFYFIQINLSFSLVSALDEEDEEQAFAQDLLDFFIDSIGATLKDINDAELKYEKISC